MKDLYLSHSFINHTMLATSGQSVEVGLGPGTSAAGSLETRDGGWSNFFSLDSSKLYPTHLKFLTGMPVQ